MALLYFDDLSLIKSQCNVDSSFTDDDDLFEAIENAVVQHGQNLTGRQFVAADFVKELDAFPASGIIFLKPNLQSVTSIKYYTDASDDEQTLDTDQYDVKTLPEIGIARLARDCSWPSGAYDITIEYNAGYDTGELPKPIILWMLVNISTRYEHREDIVSGSSASSVVEMPTSFADSLLDLYKVHEAA